MQPDMTISWDQHLKKGNAWKLRELSCKVVIFTIYNVEVYSGTHISTCEYIVTTMYPDYESISVEMNQFELPLILS